MSYSVHRNVWKQTSFFRAINANYKNHGFYRIHWRIRVSDGMRRKYCVARMRVCLLVIQSCSCMRRQAVILITHHRRRLISHISFRSPHCRRLRIIGDSGWKECWIPHSSLNSHTHFYNGLLKIFSFPIHIRIDHSLTPCAIHFAHRIEARGISYDFEITNSELLSEQSDSKKFYLSSGLLMQKIDSLKSEEMLQYGDISCHLLLLLACCSRPSRVVVLLHLLLLRHTKMSWPCKTDHRLQ